MKCSRLFGMQIRKKSRVTNIHKHTVKIAIIKGESSIVIIAKIQRKNTGQIYIAVSPSGHPKQENSSFISCTYSLSDSHKPITGSLRYV